MRPDALSGVRSIPNLSPTLSNSIGAVSKSIVEDEEMIWNHAFASDELPSAVKDCLLAYSPRFPSRFASKVPYQNVH